MTRKWISLALLVAMGAAGLFMAGCQSQPATPESSPAAAPAATPAGPPPTAAPPAAPTGTPTVSAPGAGPSGSPGAGVQPGTTADITAFPGYKEFKDKKAPKGIGNDPATLAKGKTLFATNCSPCHGDAGKGDGIAGAALDPKPRDFTAGQFKYGTADWQLARTIWEGVPNSGMVGWNGRMQQPDAWTLVYYVKSLKTP